MIKRLMPSPVGEVASGKVARNFWRLGSQSALVFVDFPAKINVFQNGDGVPQNRRRG